MRFANICVFCGSSTGENPAYAAAAVELGVELVRRGIGLVYGGGRVGLMGLLADTVLGAGGRVTGVIPRLLFDREVGHNGLTELIVVDSMHARKAEMAARADAFIALPGGFGTLEEYCEAVTWTQLGLQRKPAGLLNVAGFFTPLLAMFDRAVAEGFIAPANRGIIVEGTSVPELLEALAAWTPAALSLPVPFSPNEG